MRSSTCTTVSSAHFFSRAKRHHAERFQASGKSINDKVRIYSRIGRALLEAKQTANDPFAAIEAIYTLGGVHRHRDRSGEAGANRRTSTICHWSATASRSSPIHASPARHARTEGSACRWRPAGGVNTLRKT